MAVDTSYVIADLLRNPRRTLSTVSGVVLGVGLFCGVLFFVDGLSASMTQRAVAPLPIDMQRIVTQRAGTSLILSQSFDALASAGPAEMIVILELVNRGDTTANEVTVRSLPAASLAYVAGSAAIDRSVAAEDPLMLVSGDENPFAQGAARSGVNLGAIAAGETVQMTYRVTTADSSVVVDDNSVSSTFSTRESINTIRANAAPPPTLIDLAERIAATPGVAHALPLSIGDLGSATITVGELTAPGPTKIFGFSAAYDARDESIDIVEGRIDSGGAVLSGEAATTLGAELGETVAITLPDDSTIELTVTGVADLSRSRSLFSSRRGGDLETFVYVRNSVIVSPEVFAEIVFPAFERAAADVSQRLKSPPIREIDITLERDPLNADPATAVVQTKAIGEDVLSVAVNDDYLLDNISNTLGVAADDASVAKRLFVFLGVPGALLAAVLSAYAGNVLAEAQRREHATLRIRGASRRHLLRLLAARTALLTATGSIVGLTLGYLCALAILGRESLQRANPSSLLVSALVGTVGGFVATGAGLYLTGRRSIDREIAEDRAQMSVRSPLWRRAQLDVVGVVLIVAGTIWAVTSNAFDGAAGSVYFGRSVQLNLWLLILPVAAWISGSLVAARLISHGLRRADPRSTPTLGRVAPALYRRSVGRRPWAISNGAIVTSLIVGMATSLAAFTASYDVAKSADARYANGADIRISPSPTAARIYGADSADEFASAHIATVTPVIYSLSNVVLRSDRTSDPGNVAAVDPESYLKIAPLSPELATQLRAMGGNSSTILLNREMARYLKAQVGDTIHALLARSTPEQVDVPMRLTAVFERLPGFPDGADAVIDIATHTAHVPTKAPDFFLGTTVDESAQTLASAVADLEAGPAGQDLHIDTRASVLDRDQSSLAALNIAGLVDLDSAFALAMAIIAIAIFVFGLLLQRRREYVTLRAQGLDARTVRTIIASEAATVAVAGCLAGMAIGAVMGLYFVRVLRPLFVLDPAYRLPLSALLIPIALVGIATIPSTLVASRLVNALEPTELLRDE